MAYPVGPCLDKNPHGPHDVGPPIRMCCPGVPEPKGGLGADGRWHNHTDDGIHNDCPGCSADIQETDGTA